MSQLFILSKEPFRTFNLAALCYQNALFVWKTKDHQGLHFTWDWAEIHQTTPLSQPQIIGRRNKSYSEENIALSGISSRFCRGTEDS